MGFKRRKKYDNRKKTYDNRNNQYRKKDKFHPKRAIVGIIVLIIGILIVYTQTTPFRPSLFLLVGMGLTILGGLFLAFSPNRKGQAKISRGIDKIGGGIGNALAKSMEGCKCCECRNCGKDHNHWTHRRDRDDDWDGF